MEAEEGKTAIPPTDRRKIVWLLHFLGKETIYIPNTILTVIKEALLQTP